jgi:hypothetical protein
MKYNLLGSQGWLFDLRDASKPIGRSFSACMQTQDSIRLKIGDNEKPASRSVAGWTFFAIIASCWHRSSGNPNRHS